MEHLCERYHSTPTRIREEEATILRHVALVRRAEEQPDAPQRPPVTPDLEALMDLAGRSL